MFSNLPRMTKNILLINLLMWFLCLLMERRGLTATVDLNSFLGLHYFTASSFHWWQPVTYMFMHANFGHLFCNMFAVLMFAPVLEREWGEGKFLLFYFVCGLGAAFVQELIWGLRIEALLQQYEATSVMTNYAAKVVTIGASGAVFGILLAFGWLFPDVPMFILFLPIPIRARTFVIIYACIELVAGLANLSGDNVAHFAHLGGMLFGWLLLLWWRHDEWHFRNWHWPWRKYPHLDSKKDSHFSDFHYQRRVDD